MHARQFHLPWSWNKRIQKSEARKLRVTWIALLILHLIDWEGGAIFLDQTHGVRLHFFTLDKKAILRTWYIFVSSAGGL